MKKPAMKMINKINILFFAALSLAFLFSSCSMPEDEKKDALKILEIREELLNSGKINKFAVLLTDNFPKRKEYLDQLAYRNFYFTEYAYTINSVDFLSYSFVTKKAAVIVNFDLLFKVPEDPAETVFLGRMEKVTLEKEKIGWKIAAVEEIGDSGRKIEPQLVHDIFYPLNARKTAISNGDAALFVSVVHPDFAAREELLSDFSKNLTAFSEINYELKGRRLISVSEDRKNAEVLQYYNLFFKTREGNISEKIENQKEIISLKKVDDENWKIIGGLR